MSEEFLAQQDSQLYWFVGIGIFVVLSFVISYFVTRNSSEKRKASIKKKFLLANLSVFVIYIFLTIPYTGFFYDFGSKKEFPTKINSNEQVSDHIKDHHNRIEYLEREVEESREELRLLRDHYKNLLYLIMVFVLSYSGSQIFGSKKDKDLDEIQPD